MGNSIFLRGFEIEDALLINKWRNDFEIQKLVSTSFKYVSLEIEKECRRTYCYAAGDLSL